MICKICGRDIQPVPFCMHLKHKCMIENNVKIISNYKKYIEYVAKMYGRDYLKQFIKK